mmetsp:Transcript_71047/g.98707  ORF Transcript_71047/g.98707 Transcript_71047/m.98707 type:complete len:238 (+) Transcript_71047:346-1059(+)
MFCMLYSFEKILVFFVCISLQSHSFFRYLSPIYYIILLSNSEDELVDSHFVGDGESGSQVFSEQSNLLDVGKQVSVNGGLSLLLLSDSLLLFLRKSFTGEEVLLALGGRSDLGSGEIVVVDVIEFNTSEVNLLGGGDDGGLVNSSQGDTVDFMGTSDQDKTRLQLLQEDDSLALISADEEDDNLTRLDILSESRGLVRSGNTSLGGFLSGVPLRDSGNLGGIELLVGLRGHFVYRDI